MAESKDFEILVAKIQAQLAPDAEVIHDARLIGRHTKRSRQIDVLVRQKIGQYEMLIVLECRDYNRPVDVKGVEEFHGLIDDVGANKGALVCPKGFSETAKTRANGLSIDLYSVVDTDPHKWQVAVRVPVICDFRSALIALRVQTSAPLPFKLPYDFSTSIKVYDEQRVELGTPLGGAIRKWNEGGFPIDAGEHLNLPVYGTGNVQFENGYGGLIPVKFTAHVKVARQLFFGYQPVEQMSGFKDELSGGVITNAFTLGILDPNDVVANWQPIDSTDAAPVTPVLTLLGLIGDEA